MLKTDWPFKTLGEVAMLNPTEPALSEGAPFVPMDAVKAGKREVQFTQPRGQRSGARARAGDILFARITPCLQNGKVALVQDEIERCGGSTEFIVVRAGPEVLNSFLYQWITADHIRNQVTALMKGATGRQRLNAEDLASAELPVPPLEEQKRIVELLDAATERVTELRDVGIRRSKLETEIRSAFIDELLTPQAGWVERSLSEWCIEIDTGPFGSLVHKADYVETGIPLVNPMNIKDVRIIESGIKRVSPSKALELMRHVVQAGDIVLGRRGEMGRCAVVRSEQNGWICGTGSFVLRPSEECNPDLLALWISSRKGRIALGEISSGTTMDNLGNRELGLLRVSFPDRSTQNGLLARALAFEELAADMEVQQLQRSKQLASLQQAILQVAFLGEL